MNERIKELRKMLGMTQAELGAQIGVKQTAIANYESGRNDPLETVISSICREFNVSEKWLRTGEGSMFVERSRSDQIRDFFDALEPGGFKESFVGALTELTEDQWRMIADFVRKVAEAAEEQAARQDAEKQELKRMHRELDEEYEAVKRGEEKSSRSRDTA